MGGSYGRGGRSVGLGVREVLRNGLKIEFLWHGVKKVCS